MSFDSLYLNPRKTTRDWITGEILVCGDHDGSQHEHPQLVWTFDYCEQCGESVLVCTVCNACISCCRCGNYHSTDCEWPL